MPRALILTTAAKANLTGGTFADSLTAQGSDSLAVANYQDGGARILEMWGIDSDSVAELQVIYSRPASTHDLTHGFRVMIPSLALGGAATNAAFNLLDGYGTIPLFPSDTATLQVSGTAADDVVVCYVTEYDDLTGVSGTFADWQTIQALRTGTMGIRCNAVASGTPGAYGTARAINTDDNRLTANTWYAILGVSVQTQVTAVTMTGPDWGGQRIGCPAGSLDLRSNTWFVDQTVKWGKPCIPVFNSNNVGQVNVQVVDAEASTSPAIDFFLYELSGKPGV